MVSRISKNIYLTKMGGTQSIPTTREEFENHPTAGNWTIYMRNYGHSSTLISVTQSSGFFGKTNSMEILSYPQEIEAFLDGEVDRLGGQPIDDKDIYHSILTNADGRLILRECSNMTDVTLDQSESVVLAEVLSDAFELYLEVDT